MNTALNINDAWVFLARVPVTVLVVVGTTVMAALPQASDVLQFDREGVVAGEIWRLASCHITHWSFEHLQWDLLMFLGLGVMCEVRDARRMRRCLVAAVAAVSATVFWRFPNIDTYRGLSGVDTALFALLAIQLLRDAHRERSSPQALAAGGLLLGFGAKTAFESLAGQTIFVETQVAGFVPLVWDHVAGALAGALVATGDTFVRSTGLGRTDRSSGDHASHRFRLFSR